MDISIPDLLIKDGFITAADKEKMDDFSSRAELSFIKVALNYGYISRKNYERSMANAGYKLAQVRDEAYDVQILKRLSSNLPISIWHYPCVLKTIKW